jgi:hypothetical protein
MLVIGVNVKNLISLSLIVRQNKLEHLFRTCLSNLVLYFQVRPEPTQVDHLLCAPSRVGSSPYLQILV